MGLKAIDANGARTAWVGNCIKFVGGQALSAGFVLPLTDSGSGQVNLILSRGTSAATFTRATAAWTKLASGLWAQVSTGVARSSYIGLTTAVGAYGGYLAEGQRTNSCLQARDLTNASWTKTNTTPAKDQVGIDGVTNSASSLVATAGNGTATQAITILSAAKTFSVWLKRITGTGAIQISLDNFSTNTDITALINSTTWTLVQMTQTLANPTVGLNIVTNGDKIAVDMAQLEDASAFASTPIPTTTVAVTRNADVLTYPLAGNSSNTAGTAYGEFTIYSGDQSLTPVIVQLTDPSGQVFNTANLAQTSIYDGTTNITKAGLSDLSTGVRKRASSWGATGLSVTGDGLAPATGAFDGAMGPGTGNITIGLTFGGQNMFGTIKNLRIWKQQLPDARLATMTR